MSWHQQDLVIATVLLFAKPLDVFGSNRYVCTMWNNVISTNNFCKYYFEKSFCANKPFITDENRQEFDNLDEMNFDISQYYNNDEFGDDDVEMEERPRKILSLQERLKYFEQIALGLNTIGKPSWKDNFYTKFMALVAILERKSEINGIDQQIKKLLNPLNEKQVKRLEEILKKFTFSKLLTNIAHVANNILIIYDDFGAPHIVEELFSALYINNSEIYIGSNVEHSRETEAFNDLLCGFFPNMVKRLSKVKKPLSSYMLFCKEKRSEMQKNQTENNLILKAIAMLWKELSEIEKQPYVQLAEIEKEEYKKRLEEHIFIIRNLD